MTTTTIKYLSIYLILTLSSCYFASTVWWTDSYTLSMLSAQSLALLTCVAVGWIAILYFSIFIIRKFLVEIYFEDFFGPIDLISNESLHQEVGIEQLLKMKRYLSFIAFPMLGITIFSFFVAMNYYGDYQIEKYRKEEIVVVKEIRKDAKNNEYAYFSYNKNLSANLPIDSLQTGDKIKVVFSAKEPRIIKFKQKLKSLSSAH